MYKHYIVMSSAFEHGTRIALDYVIENEQDIENVEKDIKYINKNATNDVHISSHYITVSGKSWEAVEESDGFFKGVKVLNSKEEFTKYIDDDANLQGIDVAKYILSKIPCTHLKLEKLTYFCYADYITKTGKQLFKDKILAYKLGPVISSVYKKYKKKREILSEIEDDKHIEDETTLLMPLKSRIMSSKDGIEKVFSIEETLKKYGSLGDYDLVKITHRKNSPWNHTGGIKKYNKNKIISDENIIEFHKFENI